MKWDTFLRLRLFIRLDINLVEKKGAIDRKKKKKLTTCLFLLDFSFNEIYENAFYISQLNWSRNSLFRFNFSAGILLFICFNYRSVTIENKLIFSFFSIIL